jgi:hypothetical protein
MNLKRAKRLLLLVIAMSAFGLGCELIVDFDRSRIPVEGADATPTIDATPDVTTDQGAQDSGTDAKEAGDAEAGPDADAADDAPDGD